MTTTINSSYLTNPVSFAQGGSGVATNTAYGLLAAGTSSTGAIQQLGAGTANQIVVSGGASALGAFTNNDKVGCWQLISSQTASNSASIAFASLTTSFENYKIILYNVVPVTNAASLFMQISSNGGSSYQTGSTAYFWSMYGYSDGTSTLAKNGNTSGIQFDGVGISSTAYANFWEITFIEPDVSQASPGVTFICKYDDSTNGTVTYVGQGRYNGTQATNAIQFLMSSGNISTGIFNLYGLLV